MPGSVIHELYKASIFTKYIQDRMRKLQIRYFSNAADVIYLTRTSFMHHRIYAFTIILNEEPVAYVHTVGIKRQALILKSIRYEERYDFFRVLVWPEII